MNIFLPPTLRNDRFLIDKALDIAHCGAWIFDIAAQNWCLTRQATLIYSRAALCNGRQGFLERVPLSERHRLEKHWQSLAEGLGRYEMEYPVMLDSGTKWLWESAEVEYDASGSPKQLIGVVQDISSRHMHTQDLIQRANHDTLTGLPNRNALDDFLTEYLLDTPSSDTCTALMLIDLDRFKEVNDTYGHPVGDRVLQAAAQRMQYCIRSSDMLARQGGDEFVAVLLGVESDAQAGLIALRLIEEISRPFDINGQQISIGASVGIAIYPNDVGNKELLFEHADTALYQAKRAGRVTLRFVDVISS